MWSVDGKTVSSTRTEDTETKAQAGVLSRRNFGSEKQPPSLAAAAAREAQSGRWAWAQKAGRL